MSTLTAARPTLIDALWPTADAWPELARKALLILAGTALLAISARAQIPFWPVPMTMQTFVVLVIGMVYGARLGAATLVAYLLEGAVGLPVFATGGGLAYFAGPTAGYLFGFLLAALLVGSLAERGWDRNPRLTVLAMTLGTIVIFACGVLWLSVYVGSIGEAIKTGVAPFVPAALLKIALAAIVLPSAWRLIRER
ncbi:MAG: biotin transporter BioY [Gammaproteobacteria bacterium]|nr:MAG: biotin transporter BioY [Gammaproteobacteria bacterium]